MDELGEAVNSSLGIGVIKLVVESEEQAVSQAKALIKQTQNQLTNQILQQQLIDLIELIIVYKFPQKSREEIEAMFELSDLKQTLIYQEAFAEGEELGKQQGEANLVLRQLNRRFSEISPTLVEQIRALSVEQLENLGEALLDFGSDEDLMDWLAKK